MENAYIYNPIYNKKPTGASDVKNEVIYTLRVSRFVQCNNVFFVLIDDSDNSVKKIKMPLYSNDEGYYTYKITLTFDKAGLYWYHFEIQNPAETVYLCKSRTFDIEAVGNVLASYAQVVCEKTSKVKEDFNKGIIYHIFVDRFKKSGKVTGKEGLIFRSDWGGEITKNSKDFLIINQECFGGNLQGIIDELPYIKSLGTSTIFLSPIFEAYSYHKYDTADFSKVDSMLGGEEAFKKLIAEAKKHDINILLDGVFNHVGSDSIYFNKLGRYKELGAYQSKKSKYFDWFNFENHPDKYDCWWGIDTLPKFSNGVPSLLNYLTAPNGIIAKRMKTGILGFRLDVVDEITDPSLNKVCECMRRVDPKALILGEVWEDAATKIAYGTRRSYFSSGQLDSVMNYPLKNSIINFVLYSDAEGLMSTFYMLKDHYPKEVQNNLMNFLGTHDTKRIFTTFAESEAGQQNYEKAVQLLKIASVIQYCAPGVPSVFYGDEIGLQGGEAPFCRVCFPKKQEDRDKKILAWFKSLGKLRSEEVLAYGECNVLLAHSGVFMFERKNEISRIVVAANCGQEDFKLNLSIPMINFETSKEVKDFIMLQPFEFVILIKESNKTITAKVKTIKRK